ncbi:uncharacterized protein LOC105786991 [Gossypium raimondii]|uniref:uncharacterized protein LOC105786991 n=1 Tax=Gossypium raimondii TaxID=29730 RepID=UPI00063AAB41|nr:uncharacterized protein LOC105786991 [Gossypium raimondii]
MREDLVRTIVADEQADRILAISFANPKPLDTLFWHHKSTGTYTIKSGYKLLFRYKLQKRGAYNTQLPNTTKLFYIEMWALPILSKVKIHLRKSYNFLPTFESLHKCNMQTTNLCLLCQEVGETIDHLLHFCSVTRQTLTVLKANLLPVWDYSNYKDWLVESFLATTTANRKLVVVTY